MFGCFALITNMSEKSSFNLFLVCFSSRNKLFGFRRKLIFLNFRDFSILRMSRHKIFSQTKLTCDFRDRCKKIKFVYGIDTKAKMETAEEEFFFFRTAVLKSRIPDLSIKFFVQNFVDISEHPMKFEIFSKTISLM